jgi:hypothetical protein
MVPQTSENGGPTIHEKVNFLIEYAHMLDAKRWQFEETALVFNILTEMFLVQEPLSSLEAELVYKDMKDKANVHTICDPLNFYLFCLLCVLTYYVGFCRCFWLITLNTGKYLEMGVAYTDPSYIHIWYADILLNHYSS